MDWQRLDKKATESLIQKAGTASVLFSPQTSEARRADLPFMTNYALYRLTNYAALPMISLDYLVDESSADGNGVLYLDGSTNPILQAIRNDSFVVNEENVIAYINFYYKNAPDPDGDIYVIEDLDSLVFFDLLDAEQQANLQQNFVNPTVTRLGDGRLEVKGCMVYLGSLVSATTTILGDGTIHVSSVSMMIQSTPAYHKTDT